MKDQRVTTVVLDTKTLEALRPIRAELVLRGELGSVSAAIRQAAKEAAESRQTKRKAQ